MKISKETAKRFLLSYQNLLPPRRLSGREGILAFVRKVGCLQFDPLNIAGINTDLVLQSRVKNYRPDMLTGYCTRIESCSTAGTRICPSTR